MHDPDDASIADFAAGIRASLVAVISDDASIGPEHAVVRNPSHALPKVTGYRGASKLCLHSEHPVPQFGRFLVQLLPQR